MDLLAEFRSLYGDPVLDYIQSMIVNDNLLDEFTTSLKNPSDLLNFGVKYGIFPIVEFLYMHKSISFDMKIINSYITCFNTEENDSFASAESSYANTRLRVTKLDKYTEDRNQCINYLLSLKIYSKYSFSNKRCIYQFNPKYRYLFEIS